MKTALIALLILCVSLAVGLVRQQQRHQERVQSTDAQSLRFSNQWRETRMKLDELDKIAGVLEKDLAQRAEQLAATSNRLDRAGGELADSGAKLGQLEADLKAAQAELEQSQARIAELESQKGALTRKMDELTTSISSLETQIADTKQKLATAEGNRDFLLKELQRLQDEKSMLLAQFNNLAALRAQIAKLEEEAAVSQRIAWMQKGVYSRRELKGAERLIAIAAPPSRADHRLILELEQTGRGRIVPPEDSPPARP
jgi:chromosome segregation ATPase